jgi:hypothetical protein
MVGTTAVPRIDERQVGSVGTVRLILRAVQVFRGDFHVHRMVSDRGPHGTSTAAPSADAAAGHERDHVSPWTSAYQVLRLVRSPASFVLSTGGHNVGIVNPPDDPLAHPEAGYRAGAWQPRQAPDDPPECRVEPAAALM